MSSKNTKSSKATIRKSRSNTTSKSSRSSTIRLTHPFAKKLRLIHHAHTGKLVHRQHTSYAFLAILLVITGFFVFVGYDISRADTLSGNVTVGALVDGPPPTVGAIITRPTEGEVISSAQTVVEGTCAADTQVFVYSNNSLVGSTFCSPSLTFSVQIQLFAGVNTLTALNYDALSQPGPSSAAVHVTYKTSQLPIEPAASQTATVYPVIIPGISPTAPKFCSDNNESPACHVTYVNSDTCNGYTNTSPLPKSTDVRVSIVCQPRFIKPNETVAIGVLVWGGTPPYSLTVNWGNGTTVGTDTTIGFSQPGYYVVTASYKQAGTYDIAVRITDASGRQAEMTSSIKVPVASAPNSAGISKESKNFGEYIISSISMSWFSSPVPTYLLAVTLVLGFWAGDYFERSLLYGRLRHGKKPPRGFHGV